MRQAEVPIPLPRQIVGTSDLAAAWYGKQFGDAKVFKNFGWIRMHAILQQHGAN